MCGIAGFSWEDQQLVKQMCSLIEHRGPDQHGTFTDKNASLGHRRLSILDLSENGRQPMHNEDHSIWLTFNGEIYNYKELREKLIRSGHRFYSETDSEVIIHAYEEYGENCLQYFNGCFAFAIYDSNNKKIFLARDRMGIKPLFYSLVNNNLIFASEIKSILLCPEIKRKPYLPAVDELLTFRCNSLAKTTFQGIYKLLPAHYLTYQQGKAEVKRYWKKSDLIQNKSEDYFAKRVLDQLERSVKMRMMSDVPLGAYLSGGVDSGAIVALMAKHSQEPVNTFTVGFEQKEHDESSKASFLAEKFNTNHHQINIEMDAAKTLPKVVWHLDEPMSDATCLPVYLMAEKTKPYATVVLTGDGGDEQFIGYDQFKFLKIHHNLIRATPLIARKSFSSLISTMPQKFLDALFKYSSSLGEQGILRSRDFVSTNDYAKMYLSLVSIFDQKEKQQLFSEASLQELRKSDYRFIRDIKKEFLQHVIRKNYLNKLNDLDTAKILPEDFLMKVDKNTMAHAIEARVPILDHHMTELASSIPQNLKLKFLQDKYIFRKAVSSILPKEVFQRKKDRFFVPINSWCGGEIGEITKQILSEEKVSKQNIFRHSAVADVFSHYQRSPLYSARQQWTLLNFQMWHKLFIETDDFKDKNKIRKLNLDYFV